MIKQPEHYQKIYGYFDFEPFYYGVLDHFRAGGTFVEIGTWLGKSTCFMAEAIKGLGCKVKFYGVDTFLGEVNAKDQQDIVLAEGGSIYKAFLRNMKNAGVMDYVTPLQMTSKDASTLFDDNSLEFVFLDAEHLYDDVLQDLNLWYPKVRSGGIIAGHDYYAGTQVKQAVDEFFDKQKDVNEIKAHNTCFYVTKP
jgi:predicted O-methyltransferase YrrM